MAAGGGENRVRARSGQRQIAIGPRLNARKSALSALPCHVDRLVYNSRRAINTISIRTEVVAREGVASRIRAAGSIDREFFLSFSLSHSVLFLSRFFFLFVIIARRGKVHK